MISKAELKFIRSLKIKKYRNGAKCFLVEGEKNVLELISSNYTIKHLLVTSSFLQKYHDQLQSAHPTVVSERDLAAVSALVTNDQAVAVAEMQEFSLTDFKQDKLFVALDGVNDPGNLGTIIRTMDWFGITQLICSPDTVDFYNPKTIHASKGSFARVRFTYTDLATFLQGYSGIKVGADIDGKPFASYQPAASTVLVMGSESHGISSAVASLLDEKVTIPKLGHAESLNVGVAAGILFQHFTA